MGNLVVEYTSIIDKLEKEFKASRKYKFVFQRESNKEIAIKIANAEEDEKDKSFISSFFDLKSTHPIQIASVHVSGSGSGFNSTNAASEIISICQKVSGQCKDHQVFGMQAYVSDQSISYAIFAFRRDGNVTSKQHVKESSNIPMIEMLVESGINQEQSSVIFEAMLEHNPYIALLNIPLDPEPVTEAEVLERDNALFEAFLTAYEATEGDSSLVLAIGLEEAAAASVAKTVGDKVSRAARATADTVKDAVTSPVRTTKRGINTLKHKVVNPLINTIMGSINDFEKANEESKREMIIKGGFLPRLRRLFYKALVHFKLRPLIFAAIPGGFATLIAWFPITLYTAWQLFKEVRGDADDNTKARIVQELELELKMTREKIDDAKAAGDKKAKYQLMRVENKIIHEISRIKYGAAG